MPPRVVYLGPVGAFTHEAAREYFSDSAELIAAPSIPAVFETVTRG
ncbi:MAG: Prephenate dehydratase, partial [Pseudomonadota bacterium]